MAIQTKLKMEIHDDYGNNDKIFSFRTGMPEFFTQAVAEEMVREMAKQMATEYVKDHFKEIMERISPEAIANVAIAEAGAEIHTTLQKKLPDRIDRIVETEVYQKGVFGGIKRIR
jgi:hypothetical protein